MSNVFERAAAKTKGHWTRGAFKRGDSCCGMGWVRELVYVDEGLLDPGAHDTFHKYWDFADDYVYNSTLLFNNFAEFNDHPDTTEQQVIDVLLMIGKAWDESQESTNLV